MVYFSVPSLKVVGGAYGKRKGFIYKPISTQNKKRQDFLPVFFVLSSFHKKSTGGSHPVSCVQYPLTVPAVQSRPRRRLRSARSALTRLRFRPPGPAWSGSCNTAGSFWSRHPSQCCEALPSASEYRFQSPQWHNSCPWGFPVFSVKCGSPPPCCSLSERFPDNALPGALQ